MESLVELVTSNRPNDFSGDRTDNKMNNSPQADHPNDRSDDSSYDHTGNHLSDHHISPAHQKYYKSLLLSCQPQAKSFWAFFQQLPQFKV